MLMDKSAKSAMITVELGLSLVLITVVIFVALGLFGGNLKELVASGNFHRVWENNDNRTMFAAFKGRDYSTSQINVQVMGEQGLKNLRQKANNNLLKILPDLIANKDPLLAVSAAYQALIIQNIVGNNEVCSFMAKPSNELCQAMNLEVDFTAAPSDGKITVTDTKNNKTTTVNLSGLLTDALGSNAIDNIDKATKDLIEKIKNGENSNWDTKNFTSTLEKAIQEAEEIALTPKYADEFITTINGINHYRVNTLFHMGYRWDTAQEDYKKFKNAISTLKKSLASTKKTLNNVDNSADITSLIDDINANLTNAEKALNTGHNRYGRANSKHKYLSERGSEWYAAAYIILYDGMTIDDIDKAAKDSKNNIKDNLSDLGYNIGKKDKNPNNVQAQLAKLKEMLKK